MDITGLIFTTVKPAAPAGSVNLPAQVDVNGPNTAISISAPLLVGDTGTGGAAGLAPAPPAGAAASGKFLKADGTFAVTPGTLGVVGVVIDGGGMVPTTGSKGVVQIPYAGMITGWTLLGDVSGSAQVTVSKATYAGFPTVVSIVASAPPSMSSAQKNTSTSLTGWTTAIAAGDILSFNLDSVTSCKRLVLELQITRS